jgi:hypothetical protein
MNNAEILIKLSKCKLFVEELSKESSEYYRLVGEPRELSKMADWCSSKKIRPFHRKLDRGSEIHVNKESADRFLETQKGFMTGAKTGIL